MRYLSRDAFAGGQTGVAAGARARLSRARRSCRPAAFAQEHEGGEPPQDEAGDDPIANRGDRYVAEPPGTIKKMRFWYGPYVMPAGWDANRVDVDIPVHNGMILQVEPELRVNPDWKEPSHQVAHIHHAHWFALDPGNQEDNYTAGNTEWIFGNGDEETRADFMQRSNAQPKGPFYGEYIGLAGPQAMIYMLHNKTAQTMVGYVVLNVTFKYGTIEQLNATGREHRDLSGVLFGRTFDVPRQAQGRRRRGTRRTTCAPRRASRARSSGPRPSTAP